MQKNIVPRRVFVFVGFFAFALLAFVLASRIQALDGNAFTVKVLSPNGGEFWGGGQTQTIAWQTTGTLTTTNPITLSVSWNAGATWSVIATNQPNTGSYAWAVPTQNEPDVLVRVAATGPAGVTVADTSDALFTVDSLIQVPGSLAASPNQLWTNANSFTLQWTNPPDLSGISGAYYRFDNEPTSSTDGTFVSLAQPKLTNLAVPGDGKHNIFLWLKDRAGNVSHTQRNALFNAFWFDGSAPTSSAELTGVPGVNGWHRSAINVSLSALDPDPGSGVASISHRLNNEAAQTTTNFSVTTPGVHTLLRSALDRAGNREITKTLTLRIDPAPPTVTASVNGTLTPSGWYREPVTVTFNAADAVSGVAGARSRIDNAAWITGTQVVVNTDGNHQLDFTAVDVAGNESPVQTRQVPFDAAPPSTAYQPDPASVLGDNGWYRSFITITLIPVDEISGVANTFYRIDGGAWLTGTRFVLNQEGEHIVEFYSVDVAGNAETPFPVALKIDTQSPNAPPSPQTSPLVWTNQNRFSFLWSKPNDRSGIAGAYYRVGAAPAANVDGGFSETQIVEGLTVPAQGQFDLYIWLRDGAGNVDFTRATRVAGAFRYDATPPVTSVALAGPVGENGWFVGPVSATLTVTDALAGVAGTSYRIDNGSWKTGLQAAITGSDKHTLTFYSTDQASNAETPRVQTIRIDENAPGTPQNVRLTPSGWSHVNSFDVAWTSDPDLSGVAGIFYKFDQPPQHARDGQFLPGAGTASGLRVPSEGQHTLFVWLKDFAGNADHTKRVTLTNAARFDVTPPTTSAQILGTQGANGWYVSSVQFALQPTDAGSGLATTQSRVNGGQWLAGTSIAIGYDGQHVVQFRSTDVAGNVETTRQRTVNVDATAPFARIESLAPTQTSRSFTLRWSGRDRPGSGVVGYDLEVRAGRGGAWTSLAANTQTTSMPFTGQHGVTYYFRVRARDAAGNVGAFASGDGDASTYISGAANGNFETGNFTGWQVSGAMASAIVPPPAPPPPAAGNYVALLGSPAYGQSPREPGTVPVGSAVMTQTIAVPALNQWPSTKLTLWYRIFTYDVVFSERRQQYFDSFDVYLLSSRGVTITHLLRDGNNNAALTGEGKPVVDLGWKQATFDLTPFAGQTVQLYVANSNRVDRLFNTWTYVDNVTISTPVRRMNYLPFAMKVR